MLCLSCEAAHPPHPVHKSSTCSAISKGHAETATAKWLKRAAGKHTSQGLKALSKRSCRTDLLDCQVPPVKSRTVQQNLHLRDFVCACFLYMCMCVIVCVCVYE